MSLLLTSNSLLSAHEVIKKKVILGDHVIIAACGFSLFFFFLQNRVSSAKESMGSRDHVLIRHAPSSETHRVSASVRGTLGQRQTGNGTIQW